MAAHVAAHAHLLWSTPVVVVGDFVFAALGAWGGWYLRSRKANQVNTIIQTGETTVATVKEVASEVKATVDAPKPQ